MLDLEQFPLHIFDAVGLGVGNFLGNRNARWTHLVVFHAQEALIGSGLNYGPAFKIRRAIARCEKHVYQLNFS